MFIQPDNLSLKQIADAVQRLSDFYIQHPKSSTPWSESYCQIAYRYYFLPLNFERVRQVINRGLQVDFFKGLRTFIDWGAGPGTASFALSQNSQLKTQISQQILIDRLTKPFQVFADLHSHLIRPQHLSTLKNIEPSQFNFNFKANESALVMSYALTEVTELPQGWQNYEALMLLEPATSEDGRKLLEIRKKLIANGYFIWAPCIHQNACPLLEKSKTDWCHDRFHVEAPDWFTQLEDLLPMKNKTITTSYLLARRTAPTFKLIQSPDGQNLLGRLTGDSRDEKGKTRQMICRQNEREFLTWMHKNVEPQTFSRGDLVCISPNHEAKSNEIRLKDDQSSILGSRITS